MNNQAINKQASLPVISERIRDLITKNEINFPDKYSPENAMKSLWLQLSELRDKNGKLAIEVCSKESIANAMLDMVLQGLSPAKKQCYPIVYGSKLQLTRSYFGTQAVAKRITGALSITAMTIHEGDELSFEIINGNRVVTGHKQAFDSIDKPIVGAYCVVTKADGSQFHELMTIKEIHANWKKSKANPITDKGNVRAGTVHSDFPQEMAKRTVISRACKNLINTSDDSDLTIQAYNRTTEDDYGDPEPETIIEQEANQKPFVMASQPEEEEPEPKKEHDRNSGKTPAVKQGENAKQEEGEDLFRNEPICSAGDVKYINALISKALDKGIKAEELLKGQELIGDDIGAFTKNEADRFADYLKKRTKEAE